MGEWEPRGRRTPGAQLVNSFSVLEVPLVADRYREIRLK